MITDASVKPGDEVFVLASYNKISRRIVGTVEPGGVRAKDNRIWLVPWSDLFATEREAYKAMVARAEREVKTAEREVVAARRRLDKLRKNSPYVRDAFAAQPELPR